MKGTYYPAVFRHAGETVSDTYIRLRGRTSNWIGTKMQLQISFNRVDKDARFHGLRKLMLDASPWDHSLLRERVALAYLRDAGQPAPSLDRPRQVEVVLASDAWRAVYIAELREALAAYDVASLQARVDTWARQIAADVAADPNRSFSDEEHAAAVAEVKSFLAARRTFMDGWLAAR